MNEWVNGWMDERLDTRTCLSVTFSSHRLTSPHLASLHLTSLTSRHPISPYSTFPPHSHPTFLPHPTYPTPTPTPVAVGYQPTLATDMGLLQERITSTGVGSITSVQAVYVPADDLTDPAPATTFAHLDATTVLSRQVRYGAVRSPVRSPVSHSFLVVVHWYAFIDWLAFDRHHSTHPLHHSHPPHFTPLTSLNPPCSLLVTPPHPHPSPRLPSSASTLPWIPSTPPRACLTLV